MDELKQTIIDSMPINVSYKLYIYDEIGKILFNNNIGWKSPVKMFDTRSKKECSIFLGWISLINIYNKKEKKHIINFIFQEVFKSLLNTPNIKHL